MKLPNKLFAVLLLISALAIGSAPVILSTGCKSTLEQGGAYAPAGLNPDKAFFVADASFYTAYSAIDAAFTYERDNRAALWAISHDIKHALDAARPKAVEVRNRYIAARKAYVANPTPAGLSQLQTILGELGQIQAAVTAALPK